MWVVGVFMAFIVNFMTWKSTSLNG